MIEQLSYMPEEYLIGHPAIDTQHEVLFVFYHEVLRTLQNGQDSYDLTDIFLGLNTYVLNHFKFEEDAMLETNFQGVTAHIEEHRWLKEQVVILNRRFVAAKDNREKYSIAGDIAAFLADWLKHHISEVDRQLADHLNNV